MENLEYDANDPVWVKETDETWLRGTVTFVSKKDYTVAVLSNKAWSYIQTDEKDLRTRKRTFEQDIFELLDKIWILESDVKSIGIVVGFEKDKYIIKKYTDTIWRRVVSSYEQLEHRTESYDTELMRIRNENIDAPWLKWNLPSNWRWKNKKWIHK